jgi:hypothetical protein
MTWPGSWRRSRSSARGSAPWRAVSPEASDSCLLWAAPSPSCPKLLMLDEPSFNLAPLMASQSFKVIRSIADSERRSC